MRKRTRLAAVMAALLFLSLQSQAWAQQPGAGDFERMLEFGRTLSQQGRHRDAAVKFWQVVASGSEIERYYKEAEFQLGVSLAELKLFESAYAYFERIADAGDSHPYHAASLEWLLRVQRAVPGDIRPLEQLASYDVGQYPAALADELSFLVGQHHYYEGDLDASLEMLTRVQSGAGELFLKARYLQGVVHVRRNEAQPAVDAFKDILRYQRDAGADADVVRKYAQMATLSLARIFYTTGQYATAVRYYDRIEQFSPLWLDTVFEVSWAYFQLENYGRALGNLHTLNSPYFEEEYFPESMVLQAVIFYYNCMYDEALEVIDRFVQDYYQLKKELETQLSSYADPNEFYLFLARLSQKGSKFSLRLKRIFNAALSDQKLSRLLGLVVTLNAEVASLEELKRYAPAHDMADAMVGDIIAYRELIIGEAGELARSRLERVNRELKDLLAQGLKVKFETLARQKQGAGGGEAAAAPEPFVDDEHMLWKFQGEYWRDELDSYLFKISSQCPATSEGGE